MKYRVFLVRVKDNSINRVGAKWVVCILQNSTFTSISSLDRRQFRKTIFGQRRYKRFKGIASDLQKPVVVEGIKMAYATAMQFVEEHRKEGRSLLIHQSSARNRLVYLFQLKPSVWENNRFLKSNTHIKSTDGCTAWYVGETSKTIPERYAAHRSRPETGKDSSTRWGMEFFESDFDAAYNDEARHLRDEFLNAAASDDAIRGVEGLNQWEAKINEAELAQWLRNQGNGAYSA